MSAQTEASSPIRPLTIGLLILLAALSRLLPHPPNFAPLAAMALFGGAYFSSRWLAFAAPLSAMLLSDILLAATGLTPDIFHGTTPYVYGAITLTTGLGLLLRNHKTAFAIGGMTLASSVLFFIISNFGVWMTSGGYYPMNISGLVACYTAAIPFYQYSILGDITYVGVLFGGFALLQSRYPKQLAAA